jgi:isopentenyl phosphate kinase
MRCSHANAKSNPLIFLKLGGSLITDKATPYTPRPEVISRLAGEIATALETHPGLKLVLGHGSGSFGHVAAERFGTRRGVDSPEGWRGFAQVWYQASRLNRIVIEALHGAGLAAVALPPSGAVTTRQGQVTTWNLSPLRAALSAGLLPVVYGDVVFDQTIGGTILSTEDLFAHLARALHPSRILLAGQDRGVWADYPACSELVKTITPQTWCQLAPALDGSANTDVTGGMASKVETMLTLVEEIPGLEGLIFSGEEPGQVSAALNGQTPGTRIHAGR